MFVPFSVYIKDNFRKYEGALPLLDGVTAQIYTELGHIGAKAMLHHILEPVSPGSEFPWRGTKGLPTYTGSARSAFDELAARYDVDSQYIFHPDSKVQSEADVEVFNQPADVIIKRNKKSVSLRLAIHGPEHLIENDYIALPFKRRQREMPWNLFEEARFVATHAIRQNSTKVAGQRYNEFLVSMRKGKPPRYEDKWEGPDPDAVWPEYDDVPF